MKSLLVLILSCSVSLELFAQKNITMCHGSVTDQFAAFASAKTFVDAHEAPLPYMNTSGAGKNITFKAADGSEAYGYLIKAKSKSNKYLLVFHEWWGLNDYIKKESEKLYNDLQNVNVLAIDLYDKKVATTSEEASKLSQEVQQDRAEAIIKGAIKYAGENAQIGTIGWCFGGGWSLQAAIIAGEQANACVMYYGMPALDVEKLKQLDCDVLGLFAGEDQWITPAVVKEFAEKMKETDNDLEYKIYDGAVHAFANPSNPKHDSAATQDAYTKTINFLKKEL